MSSSDIAIKDARCGPETHVVIDILKLRYEWSNYKHLRERNEAAGINKEIIDKVGPATNWTLLTPAPPPGRVSLHTRDCLSPRPAR